MDKATKLTLAEFMARKEQILQARKVKETKELYIPSLDANITIEEPDKGLCRDCMEMDKNGDDYLVLKSVKEPPLCSPEIMEAVGCAEPLEVVDAIFKPGEITQIAKECLVLAGYDGVKEVKNIKN